MFNHKRRGFYRICFSYVPLGPACKDTLWVRTTKRIFSRDTMTRMTHLDGILEESLSDAYSVDRDSLSIPVLPTYHFAYGYAFRSQKRALIYP